jgi:hypothetical protein
MFKKFTLLNCILVITTFGYSQSLSPSVIPSAGESNSVNGTRLDWTLGELAVESVSTLEGLYTEGFHQPLLIVKSKSLANVNLPFGYNVTVFPNPVTSIFNVNIQSLNDSKVFLRLSDLNGRTVYNTTTNSKGSSIKINIASLAAGVYLLSITNSSGFTISTYKIIKAA